MPCERPSFPSSPDACVGDRDERLRQIAGVIERDELEQVMMRDIAAELGSTTGC